MTKMPLSALLAHSKGKHRNHFVSGWMCKVIRSQAFYPHILAKMKMGKPHDEITESVVCLGKLYVCASYL